MDFTGQGRFTAYKVDRPLTEQEKADRLDRKRRLNTTMRDELSVIKINSTYMELVDRWYAPKGWSVVLAIMLGLPCLAAVISFPVLLVDRYRDWGAWAVIVFIVTVFLTWLQFRFVERHVHYG